MSAQTPTITEGPQSGTLAGVAARTTSGSGSAVTLKADFAWVAFELVLTAASGGAGDTLDVYVQQSLDGTNWDDVAHFAQLNGTSGTDAFSCSFPLGRVEAAAELHTWRDGTLAAGTVVSFLLGRTFRAKWVIAGSGSFTFGVFAFPRATT